MNLNTQCPQCATTFQVHLEQLQLRKGYIRCINCAHIFDGYEAVVPSSPTKETVPYVPEQPVVPPVIPASSASAPESTAAVDPLAVSPSVVRHRIPTDQHTHHIPANVRPTSSAATPEFIMGSDRESPADHLEPEFRVGKAAQHTAEPVFDLGKPRAVADEPMISVIHTRSPQGAHPSLPMYVEARNQPADNRADRTSDFAGSATGGGAMSVVWQLAILVGLVVLVAQLAYVYRVQIANQVPALRPTLEAACAHLKCTVPYARRIDLIDITGAALNAQTPAQAGAQEQEGEIMVLQLTLRNTYEKPQEWPTLELDLNDFSGTLQVRKNITPKDYLTPEQLQRPFGAKSEQVLRLPIVLRGLKINGFQIRKYFP